MIENPFRPPYEAISGMTATLVAGGIVANHAMLSPSLPTTATTVAGLAALAGVRFRQAWRIHRSRRNLRRLTNYVLRADEIPSSSTHLFLGLGFRWTAKHTQRLHLIRQPRFEHLRVESKLYKAARTIERRTEGKHWLCRYTKQDKWWNPVAPLPPVGGDPAIHGLELDEEEVWQDIGERVGHTLVLGTTRVGKTRLAEILVTQDIRRGDEVVVMFDPKGDDALMRRMYAEAVRAGRGDQFYVFHLGFPEISARYNPVGSVSKITEVATRTAGPLPSEGQSATFRQFVWRFVNVMAKALSALGHKPSYKEIYKHAVNIDGLCAAYFDYWLDRDAPGWRTELGAFQADGQQVKEKAKKTGRGDEMVKLLMFIGKKGLNDDVGTALMSVLSNDRTYFEKLVSSLYPLLEKLTTGDVAALLSPNYDDPDDPRPIIDWNKIIDQGGIVYFGMDSLTDAEVASAVGNSAFADLTSTAGKLYKFGQAHGQRQQSRPKKISIHGDEFNELIGDEFVPLLNKSGGAGFQVTVYTQTWDDVEAKIGSAAKAGQIGGNLNNLIMLRVKTKETAEILTSQLPKVRVPFVTQDSGANDVADPRETTDFTSSTKDRVTETEVDMLQPADLIQLPKGQAFALINGGQLFKLRMPLASSANDPLMPAHLDQMSRQMAERYRAAYPENDLVYEGTGSGW